MTTPSEAAPGAAPPQPTAAPAPAPAPEPEPDRAQDPVPTPAPAPVTILVPSVTVVQKVETVIDVKCCGGAGADADDTESEKVCRICHLSPDLSGVGGGAEGCELIQIGCGCRGELGIAHRHCAEAWFRVKGNRCCEICGVNAKNITGEDDSGFMEEWHERRTFSNRRRRNFSEGGSCWRGQPCCNFLMACLVIAFILPWFFRVNIF
ncbi:Zinc finger RING/FYVE/PHD-type protein [Dioscorea alata]|uniref:Zinc finger RING/FYVE/PHD-type protein n=1 Tax=Dioscorea alata TaxID=55571 RepID=A0ACB7UBQ4_DIOAL|nr:Zinc finger RING/FYVE/PHD-type protein [Dioscorea alata]